MSLGGRNCHAWQIRLEPNHSGVAREEMDQEKISRSENEGLGMGDVWGVVDRSGLEDGNEGWWSWGDLWRTGIEV